MTKLFLDDQRTPEECVGEIYDTGNWDLVGDFDEFQAYIMERGVPDVISFDHDLADDHYDIDWWDVYKEGLLAPTTFRTGLDCIKWLRSFCLESNSPMPECLVHSMNPVGREAITDYIETWTD